MNDNPYQSSDGKHKSVTSDIPADRTWMRRGFAVVLFFMSAPMLLIGSAWAVGGSRPHYAHIVIPLGIVTLLTALTMIGIGVHLCFRTVK